MYLLLTFSNFSKLLSSCFLKNHVMLPLGFCCSCFSFGVILNYTVLIFVLFCFTLFYGEIECTRNLVDRELRKISEELRERNEYDQNVFSKFLINKK